jgi:hypothetical protein
MATPAAYTAYRETITFDDPRFGPLMADYADAQRRWLAANADPIGYAFLDPVEEMQKAAPTAPLLYFPSNSHLTAEGHALLAATVGPRVARMLAGRDPMP